MKRFRVECNFGCKYFKEVSKARKYFQKCIDRHLDAEIWFVAYYFDEVQNRYFAGQVLLEYSPTSLPKY